MFTQIDDAVVWNQIVEARTDLYEYLCTLSAAEWNRQSLCDGWLVRDVVAHLIILYQYLLLPSLFKFAKTGLRFNIFLKQTAIQYGKKDSTELLSNFKLLIDHKTLPFFVPPLNVLADTLIHEQDICLALGHERSMPLASLQLLFDHWEPGKFNIGEVITGIKKRTKGLDFKATDIDAHYGAGLIVSGRAENLLLIMLGRSVVLDKLSGPGLAVLQDRL